MLDFETLFCYCAINPDTDRILSYESGSDVVVAIADVFGASPGVDDCISGIHVYNCKIDWDRSCILLDQSFYDE